MKTLTLTMILNIAAFMVAAAGATPAIDRAMDKAQSDLTAEAVRTAEKAEGAYNKALELGQRLKALATPVVEAAKAAAAEEAPQVILAGSEMESAKQRALQALLAGGGRVLDSVLPDGKLPPATAKVPVRQQPTTKLPRL